LESTLLLLSANLLDFERRDDRVDGSLIVREAYNTALIRMVNGVVDPLQVGLFARPIASIAAQLGLPLWLVELRHAGTHEDLPSLDLLQRGALEVSLPAFY
jgi:ribosomal biogenesis protein LAS1